MHEMIEKGGMVVAADAYPLLQKAGLTSFDAFMEFTGGTRICHKRGRSVYRFELDGRAFYLKRNRLQRVEFLKRLSRFKLPARGAWEEWESIRLVRETGLPTITPIAYGERRALNLEIGSFTLTEELYGAEPLDAFIEREWSAAPRSSKRGEKRKVICDLARLARRFHDRGMNHQDFYLNHFFIDETGNLYLLDLQRVQHRPEVPIRFVVKDLGQLFYSSLRFPCISKSDKMFFLLNYLGQRQLDRKGKSLARKILTKNARIARHDVKLHARRRKRGELR
ncbi:lipopolysaccharide kinase InaA family protein [Desulfuromonas sp. TF]|jgi:heptose I phosphotransferase|uniref:lipopolysaccharide kinase InaA family protein n=1 Tax=Desulfuromonas sp. TF TaxID=1232410 RepID=UPI00040C9DC1|nr:lipopolysaccharide kinase InaA family protein [Desulfuromonas sp. TF]